MSDRISEWLLENLLGIYSFKNECFRRKLIDNEFQDENHGKVVQTKIIQSTITERNQGKYIHTLNEQGFLKSKHNPYPGQKVILRSLK